MLFSHVVVGSDDLEKSKKFNDVLFKIIGAEGVIDPKGRFKYVKDNQFFLITKPADGHPATIGNGGTIGFDLHSVEQVNQWHHAGIENGGQSIENPPGIRHVGSRKLYLAYLRDLDGNKLCRFYAMDESN
ncbi:VOC family protein [Commensalibacter nepenthis]|uniref:VOC family protein n=1 Tax=Commensalibacter nepenthis TaxID=3043872 RepID=A0ABT6Q9S8_9PROT|nr:VOC family protein [Commensalibacter sp. TBRC 10068]MDI2113551.1 VOC family protein [Commensalibacter sp. TBRC 10068]